MSAVQQLRSLLSTGIIPGPCRPAHSIQLLLSCERREQSKAAVLLVFSPMDASAQVLAAVADASRMVQQQLVRHRLGDALVQDVLRSAAAWLPASGAAALRHLLVPSQLGVVPAQLSPLKLSGDQLDAAFSTLRMLNKRLAALRAMAHEPASCCNAPGVSVNAQSWLVAHKAVHLRGIWQYGYSLTFQNTAQEPLQLLKKAWTVQDMSGCSRHRESDGIFGLQPIIEASASLSCKTAITLSSIKGSMQGVFELRGLDTGNIIRATVPAFALTPTALQLSDPEIAHACAALPASASV